MNIEHFSTDRANALAVAANTLVDASLSAGKTIRFTIPTTSMAPALLPGDHIAACSTRAEELRMGDIVLMKSGAYWIAHRFIGWRNQDGEKRLVTKGDNSLEMDAPWPVGSLGGKIIAAERGGKKWDVHANFIRALASRGGTYIRRLTLLPLRPLSPLLMCGLTLLPLRPLSPLLMKFNQERGEGVGGKR